MRGLKTFIFFEEGKEDKILYTCRAYSYVQAFNLAYDNYGPQVEDWFCKIERL